MFVGDDGEIVMSAASKTLSQTRSATLPWRCSRPSAQWCKAPLF